MELKESSLIQKLILIEEGLDVSSFLNIQKWEAPINAQLAGLARGGFPSEVPKTDEERIQNLTKKIDDWAFSGLTFEITEKLEGSSCTFYLDNEGEFHVCSRNINLKETEGNTFWKIARDHGVEDKMKAWCLNGYAIQGEVIGECIQKNYYGITGIDFYVYKIYNVNTGKYLAPDARRGIAGNLKLKHVPVIYEKRMISYFIRDILLQSEGKSVINPKKEREGLVFKCHEFDDISFKAISNRFLLKEK